MVNMYEDVMKKSICCRQLFRLLTALCFGLWLFAAGPACADATGGASTIGNGTPGGREESTPTLSKEQQKLWNRMRRALAKKYAKLGHRPNPMSPAELASLRVPVVMDGSRTGPPPWDVLLLLGFDRDLTLAVPHNHYPLMAWVLKGDIFPRTGMLDGLHFEMERLTDDGDFERRSVEGIAVFIKATGDMPALLDLPQLGGDELPCLWPSPEPGGCSLVLHFDYDDAPEFYLRSTCLFSYVLEYLDWDDTTDETLDTDTYPVDRSHFWDEARDREILESVKPMVNRLNKALEDTMESMFSEYM